MKEVDKTSIVADESINTPELLVAGDIAKVSLLLKKTVRLEGIVSHVYQSDSKKTTYMSFNGHRHDETKNNIKLQLSTADALSGQSLAEIKVKYLNRPVIVQAKVFYNSTNYRKGFYLKVNSPSEIQIVD